MSEPPSWTKWDAEIKVFRKRDTEGFTKDLEALVAHIKTLRKVCPKDKAGWPLGRALDHIGKLAKQCEGFKTYRSENTR